MELNFCDNCDNIMDLYSDEEKNELYLGCKCCGEKKKYSGVKSIYSNEYNFNLNEVINSNKHLVDDITLPTIKDNPNINCPNEECISRTEGAPSNIIYLKFDPELMSYMYVCKHCNQKWTNR